MGLFATYPWISVEWTFAYVRPSRMSQLSGVGGRGFPWVTTPLPWQENGVAKCNYWVLCPWHWHSDVINSEAGPMQLSLFNPCVTGQQGSPVPPIYPDSRRYPSLTIDTSEWNNTTHPTFCQEVDGWHDATQETHCAEKHARHTHTHTHTHSLSTERTSQFKTTDFNPTRYIDNTWH